MNITKAETIHNICTFPRTTLENMNMSGFDVYATTGYEENYKLITQEDILEYLEKHSDLILDWEGYADKKRCSPTWLFYPTKDGHTVGYYDNLKMPYELFFSKALDACTLFIKMEFDVYREHYKKYKLQNP